VGRKLVNPESWDAVRETSSPFGLPQSREGWEAAALTPEFAARAEKIAELARELGAARICSYAVGPAFLELNLSTLLHDVELICTDYAPRTVERLSSLFPEAEVRLHDLWTAAPLDADLHLLHRVDTELANRKWRRVFPRFEKPVLVVAAHLLDWRALLRELSRVARRPCRTRAGYVRTEAALRRLWNPSHTDRPIAVGDLTGYLLDLREEWRVQFWKPRR
jgi:hypothetical protein